MSRGALAFAWLSSVVVHALAAVLVIHAVPSRAPSTPATRVYIEPLGPGTGHGGERTVAPVAAPPAAAPPPPASEPRPTPKPRSATPPRRRPAARDLVAAAPADAAGAATAAGPAHSSGDGSGPGAGGGSPSGDSLGTPATPPAVLTRIPPDYPAAARESGVEGAVVLLAIVAEDGRVEHPVRVARSIPALDGAAIAALHRWRFRPGRDASGRPVRAEVEVPIRFELR